MKVGFNVERYFQVIGISLAVIIATVAVCIGIWDSKNSDDMALVDNTSTVAVANGKINILLMGTDVDGLRTDAMMLASYDTNTKDVNILSIPRDTRMYIGNRYQKINAAHAYVGSDGKIGGPTAACEAVTRLTGIPINYYVDFTFDAVAHVVNELGPVEFTIPDLYGDGVGMVYDDPVQSLHINLPPGEYKLNGQQAVWLMRYRHGNKGPNGEPFKSYPNGDKDRVEMQQKFIKALIDQKVNASLILKMPSIFKTVSSEIKTNLTVNDIIKYSKYFTDFTSTNMHSYSLPGEYGEDGANGDVWLPDMDEIRKLTREVFGYNADNITTDNPKGSNGSSKSSSGGASSNSSDSSRMSKTTDSSKTTGTSDSSKATGTSGSSGTSSGSSGSSSGTGNSSNSDEESSGGSYSSYEEDDDDDETYADYDNEDSGDDGTSADEEE